MLWIFILKRSASDAGSIAPNQQLLFSFATFSFIPVTLHATRLHLKQAKRVATTRPSPQPVGLPKSTTRPTFPHHPRTDLNTMGQALPKHHWHEADKFLIAAQLHVPHTQQQQQQQQHDRHQHNHKNQDTPTKIAPSEFAPSNRDSLSPNAGAQHPIHELSSSPPASDDEDEDPDQTTIHHTPTVSASSSSLGSSDRSSSESASSDEDEEEDPAHPHSLTDLPTREAAALAAENWARVLELAHGFERVYAGSLEAWVAGSATRPMAKSQRGSRDFSSESKSKDDGPAAATAKDRWRKTRSKILSSSWRKRHATTPTRAAMGTWTAADLVDLATRAGPLRCYRWHSAGDGRAGKERGRRQLTDDAVKMGWSGALLATHLHRASATSSSASPSNDERSLNETYASRIDPDTGLDSIAVTFAGSTTAVPPHVLALVKAFTILFPSGPPWVVEPPRASTPLPPTFLLESAERDRYHRRVWVAMALGWARCLDAFFAAHPQRHFDGGGDEKAGQESGRHGDAWWYSELASEVDGLGGEGGAEIDEDQLEQMSEIDIEDDDLLAALARAADEAGERRASLVPSDGEDDDGSGGAVVGEKGGEEPEESEGDGEDGES